MALVAPLNGGKHHWIGPTGWRVKRAHVFLPIPVRREPWRFSHRGLLSSCAGDGPMWALSPFRRVNALLERKPELNRLLVLLEKFRFIPPQSHVAL